MHSKLISFFAVCTLTLLLLTGCLRERENPVLELKLCSSFGEDITRILVAGYEKHSGVKVKIQYLPAGTFEERIQFLEDNKFDCWLGGSAEEYYMAGSRNLLQPYLTREAYKVPAELRSKRGEWTSLYLTYIAFLSNKNKLREFGLYSPETMEELLAPQLRDQLIIPDFANGGAGYGMITSLWQLRGKEAALAYAASFNAQRPQYVKTVSEAVDAVYRGEKTVTVIPLGYALQMEQQHKHLFATLIKDSNKNILSGAAVMDGAAHLKQAQDFLEYLMSDAGELLLQRNGYTYMWHVKKYPYNDGRRELIGNVSVPVDDLSWTSKYKAEIIKQWSSAK
ncbi:MAG: extracellular solute-binding protein [Acidaminococcaceae bacterium]|nr:extracellular solute-binding protein [Acidaminococcaceae bacterium]